MNKQEAIKTIEQDKIVLGKVVETSSGVNTFLRKIESIYYVPLETVVSIIDKINEPQKVTVPKFVADRVEWCKKYPRFWDLEMALSRLDDEEKLADWAYGENGELIPEKVETFARAWLDGYEVEREKLYTVEIPNPNSKGNHKIYLCKDDTTGKVYLCKGNFNPKKNKNLKLTEAEIRKDFEWAWQWAKEEDKDE